MNIKMLKAAVTGLVLIVSGFANAGLIINDDLLSGTTNHHYISVTSDAVIDFNMTSSNIDTYLWLFEDDGTLDVADLLANDDDGGAGLNSFISIFLTSGDYVISADACCHSVSETINMSNTHSHAGSYSINISGPVVTNATNVPEPSTLVIFALGIMGLASRRFKKQ